ncbi:sodium:calcium antiporter [Candidatus Peregrinibacteria bacterium]|jgi:K+-dependent Na+/Ca+ exchanger-like protein|nr:sodium:calcium antiporter [Candidatus Peregrinibacteria bacterium]MBT7703017.1 sodium:calcium antiporter [Candidatus Peregrinibacteria bacterium]
MPPITTDLLFILGTSALIFLTGKRFINASSNIGDYFRLPRSVKGATLDAISSSFPELMIALFSVIAFKRFEVGIGTIAGSALFNLLVITGISVLVAPKVFKVTKDVLTRDAFFYIISVLALLIALYASSTWNLIVPLVFLFIYIVYSREIIKDTKEFRHKIIDKVLRKINIYRELGIAFFCMATIAFASYFLTEHSISFAEIIGVPPLVIAFTVMAAATSLPDAVISIGNAKAGHVDDAAANVFGSNVFDILIGLSIPMLLAMAFVRGPIQIDFDYPEIVIGLLGSTLLLVAFLAGGLTLTKRQGWYLLGVYALFLIAICFIN